MTYKLLLKNSAQPVLLDSTVYEWLLKEPFLTEIGFLKNLRLHSSGCVVFQKSWKRLCGEHKTETIYLHKLIAERFLADQKSGKCNLVAALNGDKLDCRLQNLVYLSRAVLVRNRMPKGQTGYRGVYAEKGKFRAAITANRRTIHLGMFESADEAANAYDRAALEHFGAEAQLNRMVQKTRA